MKKLLALLPAVALLAAGCGGGSDSCTTVGTEVQPTGNCNGVAVPSGGATISIAAKPACQSCAQSSPSCDVTLVAANQLFVDVKAQECDSNKGCTAASCTFGNVSCSYTLAPAASGPFTITYRTGGTTGSETVTVGGGSATSCVL